MHNFVYSGNAFFLLAVFFILISAFTKSPAAIGLALFWFIFGLAVRKKYVHQLSPGNKLKIDRTSI